MDNLAKNQILITVSDQEITVSDYTKFPFSVPDMEITMDYVRELIKEIREGN